MSHNHDTECKCSLKIENLSVNRDGREILSNVSFEAHHAEITALIGRNGAGKTTLLKSILGRISYTGNISYYNSLGELVKRPKIGYVPQNTIFDKSSPVSVADFLCANASNTPVWLFHSKKAYNNAVSILEKVGGKYLIDKPLSALSGGELQRVLLAFALDPMPELLLIDEPVSAVDRKGIEAFYDVVCSLQKEYHMPILLVSHDLSHIQKYTTRAVLLDKTAVLCDSTENVMRSQEIKDTFGLI